MAKSITFGFTTKQLIDEGRITQEDIELLKTWSSTQQLPKLTDEQVAIFLLSCQNEQETSRETIKTYYSLKKSSPEIFDNWKLEREDLRKQLETMEYCVLPEKRSDGCAIIFARLHDTNPWNLEFAAAIALLAMTLDAELYDYPPEGLVVLCDMSGMSLMHLTRVTPAALKTAFHYLQEALPVTLKEIHVINTVHFIQKLMSLLKPFISQKVLDMLHFHQPDMNMESFYQSWLPKYCLPQDYGGDLPPIRLLHERNIAKLTRMQPLFQAEELQRHSVDLHSKLN